MTVKIQGQQGIVSTGSACGVPAVSGLQTVYITIRNFERSLEFYRLILGARESAIVPWGANREEKGAFFELPDGTRIIVSYEAAHAAPPRRQYMWLELKVEDPGKLHDYLKQAGIKIKRSPYQASGGSFAFEVTDPDGNDIRIGTRWSLPG